ncbi:hypothetical protein L596_011904 [Steinernema carpocapsae]|uniref:Uncharacterized protein n=1 Tax=Steinernema carpocapsae TaxID=34508 RepID=A0A4U5NVE3_STECR|nr:hypothetical protein L596_011904 [Steinernema carpocapsae]
MPTLLHFWNRQYRQLCFASETRNSRSVNPLPFTLRHIAILGHPAALVLLVAIYASPEERRAGAARNHAEMDAVGGRAAHQTGFVAGRLRLDVPDRGHHPT